MDGDHKHDEEHHHHHPPPEEPQANANRPPHINMAVTGPRSGTSTHIGSADEPNGHDIDSSETANESFQSTPFLIRENNPTQSIQFWQDLRTADGNGFGSSRIAYIPSGASSGSDAYIANPIPMQRERQWGNPWDLWGIGGFANMHDAHSHSGELEIDSTEESEDELKHPDHDHDDDDAMNIMVTT